MTVEKVRAYMNTALYKDETAYFYVKWLQELPLQRYHLEKMAQFHLVF